MEFDIAVKGHADTILQAVNRMREDGKNHDVTIKVGSEEIRAHKYILMAGSKYFEAMFSHDTKERNSGVVVMKDVTFEPVKACINFIYTGEVTVAFEKCEQLLNVASIMQLTSVIDQISKSLQASLTRDKFYRTKKIAEKFDLNDLGSICDSFAIENFSSVAEGNDLLEVEFDYICFLLESIKMMDTVEEDEKLKLVIKWIKSDVENRRKHLVIMFKLLDLAQITQELGTHLAENDDLIFTSAECMRMLFLARSKNNIMDGMEKMEMEKQPNAIIIFDITGNTLQAYKPSTKQMKRMCFLPADLKGEKFVAVNAKGVLYALSSKQQMHCVDLTFHWHKSKSMLRSHRLWQRAALLDDIIYITGEGSMEAYHIAEDNWKMMDTKGISCSEAEIVAYRRCIYSIGGTGADMKLVSKYCPKAEKWEDICPMNFARATPAAVCYKEMIFVVEGIKTGGGRLTDFECYDASSNKWTILVPLLQPRNLFSLCVVNSKLFAVGHEYEPLRIDECDSDSWKAVEKKADMKIMAQATVTAYLPNW